MNYTQANTEGKKHEMASKMYHMHGGKPKHTGGHSYTMNAHGKGGEKYSETGHAVKMHGGEKAIEAGHGAKKGKGEKPTQANTKGNFSTVYTQHGKGK